MKHEPAAPPKVARVPLVEPRIHIMLDSGAFSAWRLGTKIDLQEYIRFCKDHEQYLEKVINLDVIPGRPGVRRTPIQVERSAEAGWKNLIEMKKARINAMPVLHKGERLYWLEKMVGEGYKWIGIASANDADQQRTKWLDKVFDYLCRNGGYPSVRTHGFAETSVPIMLRYPWYSVDSASWLKAAAFGMLSIPAPTPYGWNWMQSTRVFVGGAVKQEHFLSMSPAEQRAVRNFIQTLGFTVEELMYGVPGGASGRRRRADYYAAYMRKTLEMMPTPRFVAPPVLFDPPESKHGRSRPLNKHPLLYFVTKCRFDEAIQLSRVGAYHRLISYVYFAGGKNRTFLKRYVEGGMGLHGHA